MAKKIMNTQSISLLGSGWLGSSLAQHFKTIGYQVHASSRSMNRLHQLQSNNIKTYCIDIDNLCINQTHKGFFETQYLIINIPSKNHNGFEKLLNVVKHSQIKHVLFVSSTSVYTNTNNLITENNHNALNHDHPLLIIEDMWRNEPAFTTTILRCGGLIGNGRNPARFFHSEKPLSTPHARVNVIHHDDCVSLIAEIIKQNTWGEIYNACADVHPTKAQFYSEATRRAGLNTPKILETPDLSFKIVNNQKIKKHLNYTFIYADPMNMLVDTKKGAY